MSSSQLQAITDHIFSEIKRVQKGEKSEIVLIKKYLGDSFTMNHIYNILLPDIRKIDGMNISRVSLNVMKEETLFTILSDTICVGHVYDENDTETIICNPEEAHYQTLYEKSIPKDYQTFNKNALKKILKQAVFEILPSLKFDKYKGVFVSEDVFEHKHSFHNSWNDILQNMSNVELTSDECCVCKDITITKTTCCNNTLCYYCWDKLKTKPRNYQFELHIMSCPMCRADLRWNSKIEGV